MAARKNDPPAEPEPQQQADPEPGRITSIEDLSARQDRTESKLDRVLDLLGGKDKDDTPTAAKPSGLGLDDIKKAIRDVGAEQQQQQADAAHAAEHDQLRQARQKEPEHQPRDVMIRGKERLQRVLFGGDK
jgi:Sec-independent protein translocase protein TatA